MAFPKKMRDLRSITVNDLVFRWRLFPSLPNEVNSVLMIYGPTSGCQPLRVTLLRWMNQWAMYPFLMPNKPMVITAHFVRQIIEFALKNGWTPDARQAAFEVEWNGETEELTSLPDVKVRLDLSESAKYQVTQRQLHLPKP